MWYYALDFEPLNGYFDWTGMRTANYEGITKAALQFMRENLARPITVPDIAKAVHYSRFHLEVTFRKTTGAGVRENLIRMRLNRAKILLIQTNLPIAEIGYNVGYVDPAYFSAAFRLREGTTPLQYRIASQAAKDTSIAPRHADTIEAPELFFLDTFSGAKPAPWWQSMQGQWRAEQGHMDGEGEDARVLLKNPLPENFRAQIEFTVIAAPGIPAADLFFVLADPTGNRSYHEFQVGANGNTMGILRQAQVVMQWNPKAIIRPGYRHKAEIELKQDRLSFRLDGQEMFAFRETFPPSYASRSRLGIRIWRNTIRLWRVAIEDLGFSTMVSAVRQGDLLYQEGLFDRAQEFYLRYAKSSRDALEMAELSYKIGMCLLGRKSPIHAREWFNKVPAFARGSFWETSAELALLEIDWEINEISRFEKRALAMFPNPVFEHGIRRLVYRLCEEADGRGFHDRAAGAMRLLVQSETSGSFFKVWAHQSLGNSLILANRLAEAEQHLKESLIFPNTAASVQSFARFSLSDLLAIMGRFDASEGRLKEIESSEPTPFNLLRCQIQRGRNLCAKGHDEEGLALLTKHAQLGEITEMATFAQMLAALVYCARKDPQNARKAIEHARYENPNSFYLQKGTVSRFLYPILVLGGDREQAAEMLKDDSYVGDAPFALRAEQAIKAGILLELAGKKQEAKALWVHTSQRFTEVRCPFFGALSSRLATGAADQTEQMPFPVANRIEMFYLVGLLNRARGNEKRAQQLFALAIEEDHMRLWPSRWAKDAVAT